MSFLYESDTIRLKQAGFTDREISLLYRQKFYNLLKEFNTMPELKVTATLASCPRCGYKEIQEPKV